MYKARNIRWELTRCSGYVHTHLGRFSCPLLLEADPLPPAIFYNITNSSLDNYRGKHDYWNSMGSGAVAGAIYKATGMSLFVTQSGYKINRWLTEPTAGVRPAMVGAGLGTAFAASWSYFKTIV